MIIFPAKSEIYWTEAESECMDGTTCGTIRKKGQTVSETEGYYVYLYDVSERKILLWKEP